MLASLVQVLNVVPEFPSCVAGALSKLLPLSWDLEQVSLCVNPSRAECQLPAFPPALLAVSPAGFRGHSKGSPSWGRTPGLGHPTGGAGPPLRGWGLPGRDVPPALGPAPGVWVLTGSRLCPSDLFGRDVSL